MPKKPHDFEMVPFGYKCRRCGIFVGSSDDDIESDECKTTGQRQSCVDTDEERTNGPRPAQHTGETKERTMRARCEEQDLTKGVYTEKACSNVDTT